MLAAEQMEDRRLLASISGMVFEDLHADGVPNTAEQGLPGWTVVVEPVESPTIFLNPEPDTDDHFGAAGAWLGDDILIGGE